MFIGFLFCAFVVHASSTVFYEVRTDNGKFICTFAIMCILLLMLIFRRQIPLKKITNLLLFSYIN
jgi:Ca2+/Na+ antiporter